MPDTYTSFGEICGVVESYYHGLHYGCLILKEDISGHEVFCWTFSNSDAYMILESLENKHVSVYGEIDCDTDGRHYVGIEKIQLIPRVPPGSYEQAHGVWDMGTAEPEKLLRKQRDSQE